ncbi:MAG: hypothetical protein IJU37_09500 [Desulfovibrio sp.]|nr:hypothetical protein [Desulfovibrio sp.]
MQHKIHWEYRHPYMAVASFWIRWIAQWLFLPVHMLAFAIVWYLDKYWMVYPPWVLTKKLWEFRKDMEDSRV